MQLALVSLRLSEWLSWAAGLAMLGFFVSQFALGEAERVGDIEAFELAFRSDAPDQSLWSQERIAAYDHSKTRDVSRVRAVLSIPDLDLEVPGRLPPEEMGRILEQIRRAAEHQGEAAEVLGGVEWKTVGELSAINVNISPRGDSTSIQIVGDRGPAGGITFVFPTAAAALLIGALGASFEPTSAAGILSLVTGTLGAGFITARTIWSSGTKKFRKPNASR